MDAPNETTPEENIPRKDCAGKVITVDDDPDEFVLLEPDPGVRVSSRGANIDQNNNYENQIPPKNFVSCSCKKPKKNLISKLIVWLDHFEPEDPKKKPRVPQINPGGGVKKKGIIRHIIDYLDPPTSRMIIKNQEDIGGGKKQYVQRWPSVKSLINKKRSSNEGGNYPYNEQTLDEVKEQTISKASVSWQQTTQTPITLANEPLSGQDLALSPPTTIENEINLNTEEKSKGCKHCKNKMKNARDKETETDLSFEAEPRDDDNVATSLNDDISIREMSTDEAIQSQLVPPFNNDLSGCDCPNWDSFSNQPCWSFYKPCDIQIPYKCPKIPIFPLEAMQQTTGSCYSCVPMNRRLLSDPRASTPCGLVQSMIAYWETSGCCRRCQEAAAATACHLAYHQAAARSRARRHRQRQCYGHCRCRRPAWVCCDSSYCCYCSNNPPRPSCSYSCTPLITEETPPCIKSAQSRTQQQNIQRDSRSNSINEGSKVKNNPTILNDQRNSKIQLSEQENNQVLTECPEAMPLVTCSDQGAYYPGCSCQCSACCYPPATLITLYSSTSSLSCGISSEDSLSSLSCCDISERFCFPCPKPKCCCQIISPIEPTKRKSSIDQGDDENDTKEDPKESISIPEKSDSIIISTDSSEVEEDDDSNKFKWGDIIPYLLWGLGAILLLALLLLLLTRFLPKLLCRLRQHFRAYWLLITGSKGKCGKSCRFYVVGLEKDLILKYGYYWQFTSPGHRNVFNIHN